MGKIVVVLPFQWNCLAERLNSNFISCLRIRYLGIYCDFFALTSTGVNGLNALHTDKFVSKLVGKDQVKDVNNADFFSGVTLKDLVQFLAGGGSFPRKISVKFTEIKQLPDPDTCFECVTLSTSTKDFKEFCKEFDCVVTMQCKGYGRS